MKLNFSVLIKNDGATKIKIILAKYNLAIEPVFQ